MTNTQPNKGTHGEEVSRWFDCVAAIILGRKTPTPIALKDGALTASFDIPLSSISASSLFTKTLREAGFQVTSHYIDTEGKIVSPEDTSQGIRVQATIADSPDATLQLDAALKAATHDAQVAAIEKGITQANDIQNLANDYYQENSKPTADSLRDALGKAVKLSPLKSTIILNALPTPALAPAGLRGAVHQGAISAPNHHLDIPL